MRLLISGDEENCNAFDKAINENKNIKVLLKSKDEEGVTYVIDHKNWEYSGKITAMLMCDRLILTVRGLERKIRDIHRSYFEAFKEQDIMTQELFDLLSIVHTEIEQSTEKHEAIMIINMTMIRDVIENIQKYDLCKILQIGLVGDEYFLKIYNENITKYKTIDILMDDHYSVLFEKIITFNYGIEWMSYTNLFFCSKFKIKLLTLDEFKRREFDKQMEAESGTTIFVNFNAKNILTKEAVLKAGYKKSKSIISEMYKKGAIRIIFDPTYAIATIKISGISYQSTKLSDLQLVEFLKTGIIK